MKNAQPLVCQHGGNKMKHYECDLEVKSWSEDGVFSGYASVFNVTDDQKDVMMPGAFAKTIKEQAGEIKLLWQHHPDEPIGVIEEIREDEVGLFVRCRLLLDLQRGKEAYSLLKAGAMKGMSIGYRVKHAEIDPKTGLRHIYEVELFEVSLVTFPANQKAQVASKSSDKPSSIRDFEQFLRDAGFSRTEAKTIIATGYKSLEEPRDADVTDEDWIVLDRAFDQASKALVTF